jgi:hypothetical protein
MNPLVIAGLKSAGKGLLRFTRNRILDHVELHVLDAVETLFDDYGHLTDKPVLMGYIRGRVAEKFAELRKGKAFWKKAAYRIAEDEVNLTLDETARRLPDISRDALHKKLVEEINERFTRLRKGRANPHLEEGEGME